MSGNGDGGDHSSMLAVYAQVGENYRQIDDLRLRLLALLPLATGTGLLVLLGGHSVPAAIDVPAGVFGMVATLSLYFYELHGVEKCAHYIDRGARLENDLDVPGSFTNRPHHIFGVVSELLPSALIYPASFAGWLFLALYQAGPVVRSVVTATVLVASVAVSMKVIDVMEKTRWRRRAGLERHGVRGRRRRERAEAGQPDQARPGRRLPRVLPVRDQAERSRARSRDTAAILRAQQSRASSPIPALTPGGKDRLGPAGAGDGNRG